MNYLLSNIPLNVDWRQILLHLLNLVILFLILYFLTYNPIKKFMEKRKKYYSDLDEKTNEALNSAKSKEDEYKALIEKAEEEIATKRRAAISDARAESEKIIKAAEEESAAILRKAGEKAEDMKNRAEEQAKEELSSVIAKIAEEKINASCTVDGFLAENDKDV